MQNALSEDGLILVVGEKGMGKSALVKAILSGPKAYRIFEYLVLPAVNLVQNNDLRQMLTDVLTQIAAIHILVIDGAENLLQLPGDKLKQLLDSLGQTSRKVVLTLTPDAAQYKLFQSANKRIYLQPLVKQAILEVFPELNQYQHVEPLINLAKVPFFLANIMRLILQTDQQNTNHWLEKQNKSFEAEIIRSVVEGAFTHAKNSPRYQAWQQLVLALNKTPYFINTGVELTPTKEMQALIDDRIVLEEYSSHKPSLLKYLIGSEELKQTQKHYHFSHDLFFEYGLMEFLIQTWEHALIKKKTGSFWTKFNQYFTAYGTKTILEKWFFLYWPYIKDDVIRSLEVIAQQPYYPTLLAVAIVIPQDELVAAILKRNDIPLDKPTGLCGYYSPTYVLLAIQRGNINALKMLLEHSDNLHHPQSGKLHFNEYSASYYDEDENKDSEQKSSLSSEEGYSNREGSDSSSPIPFHASDLENKDPDQDTIDEFIRHPNKYWQGFKIESFEYDDDQANYEIKPYYGYSYLHEATLANQPACITILLDAYEKEDQDREFYLQATKPIGMMVNLKTTEYDETPLHLAALNHLIDCAQTFLKRNSIVVDMRDYWGESPLHNAVYSIDLKIAELLLQHGANPNCLNKVGLSPYHLALARLDLPMVKLLFVYGADLSLAAFENIHKKVILANLLDLVSQNSQDKKDVEDFTIELIKLINYGWDDKGFEWGKCRNLNNSALKQAQLKQIGDLMSFVDGRVKLSKGGPGFLYWDDTSALQYAIQHEDYELLENLTEFTLSDPNHIASVLESKTFGAFKLRLLEVWLRYETDDLDHNSILHNLLHYAQQVKDNSLIKRVSEELNSESEHDDVITQTKNMQISPLTKTNANLFKSAVTNINTKPTTINLNITPTKAMKPPFTQFN